MDILKSELGWEYYGGHHYENLYTRFIHGYYLPTKFGIDKRKIEYSALIRSCQMSREDALEEIKAEICPRDQIDDDVRYVISKLGLTEADLEAIISSKNKMFIDYDTYYPIIMNLRGIISIAHKLKLYPDKVYGRYSIK